MMYQRSFTENMESNLSLINYFPSNNDCLLVFDDTYRILEGILKKEEKCKSRRIISKISDSY